MLLNKAERGRLLQLLNKCSFTSLKYFATVREFGNLSLAGLEQESTINRIEKVIFAMFLVIFHGICQRTRWF